MDRWSLKFIVVGVFAAFGLQAPAHACSCETASLENILLNDVIFYGQAFTTRPYPDPDRRQTLLEWAQEGQRLSEEIVYPDSVTRFRVIDSYRGGEAGAVDIHHRASGCCACEWVFEPGERTVVVGYRDRQGRIVTDSCLMLYGRPIELRENPRETLEQLLRDGELY